MGKTRRTKKMENKKHQQNQKKHPYQRKTRYYIPTGEKYDAVVEQARESVTPYKKLKMTKAEKLFKIGPEVKPKKRAPPAVNVPSLFIGYKAVPGTKPVEYVPETGIQHYALDPLHNPERLPIAPRPPIEITNPIPETHYRPSKLVTATPVTRGVTTRTLGSFKRACRHAVRNIVSEVKCGRRGVTVHHSGIPFCQLVENFIRDNNINIYDVPIEFRGIKRKRALFADASYSIRFRQYHNEHATLIVLTPAQHRLMHDNTI
jgi:hypothetical protein